MLGYDLRVDLVYSDLEKRATGTVLHIGKPVAKLDLDLDTDEGSGRVVGAQAPMLRTSARRRDLCGHHHPAFLTA